MSQRAIEYEARLKEVEEAAREREKVQAGVHASKLQVQAAAHAQKLQKVEDDLKQVQAELNTWKLRAYTLVAILTVSVLCIGFLLFKIAASPIVLSVYAVLFILGLVLLRIFFPEIFLALQKFLWWIWQHPFWGCLILAFFFALYYFRKKIVNKVFGATHEDTAAKIASLELRIVDKEKEIASLRSKIEEKDRQIAAQPDYRSSENASSLNPGSSAGTVEALASTNAASTAVGSGGLAPHPSGTYIKLSKKRSPHPLHLPPAPCSTGETLLVTAPPMSEDAADAADEADLDEKMLSNTPPPRRGTTALPAHTPIRDISSP